MEKIALAPLAYFKPIKSLVHFATLIGLESLVIGSFADPKNNKVVEATVYSGLAIGGCSTVTVLAGNSLNVPVDANQAMKGCSALYLAFVTATAVDRDIKSSARGYFF